MALDHWHELILMMNDDVKAIYDDYKKTGKRIPKEITEHFNGMSTAINNYYKTHDIIKEIKEHQEKHKKMTEATANVR